MAQDTPSRKLDQYIVRFPDGMRDRLKEAAANSGRSMNSEIVARLEHSLEGAFVDLSGIGFAALIMRLEATVEAYDHFMFFIRDELPGIDAVMVERRLTRTEAIHFIVSDWLRRRESAERRTRIGNEPEPTEPEPIAPRRGPEPSP